MNPIKSPLAAVLLLLCISYSSQIFCQNIPPHTCITAFNQPKIDSLKQSLISQGFALLKEASMTMESSYEMPVVMQLMEGSSYRFVFIGDQASGLYEVSLFDWKENQLFRKKYQPALANGNIIEYSFAPEHSQYHVFKPLQVNTSKQKGLCGYVLIGRRQE